MYDCYINKKVYYNEETPYSFSRLSFLINNFLFCVRYAIDYEILF